MVAELDPAGATIERVNHGLLRCRHHVGHPPEVPRRRRPASRVAGSFLRPARWPAAGHGDAPPPLAGQQRQVPPERARWPGAVDRPLPAAVSLAGARRPGRAAPPERHVVAAVTPRPPPWTPGSVAGSLRAMCHAASSLRGPSLPARLHRFIAPGVIRARVTRGIDKSGRRSSRRQHGPASAPVRPATRKVTCSDREAELSCI